MLLCRLGLLALLGVLLRRIAGWSRLVLLLLSRLLLLLGPS